jgi:hypothetical protein
VPRDCTAHAPGEPAGYREMFDLKSRKLCNVGYQSLV